MIATSSPRDVQHDDAARPRTLLLLGINYAPERIGIGVYTAGLTEAFAAAGWRVSVVTARPYYPEWRVPTAYRRSGWQTTSENGVEVLRCPLYVPKVPTGLKRILHHLSFAASAVLPMMRRARRLRPDLVMVIAPSLIAAPAGLLAAWIARTRSWLHIQDFELDAAFATGLLVPSERALRIAHRCESSIVTRFDTVSTISREMQDKLGEKAVPTHRTRLLRNWADLDAIRPIAGPSPYRSEWKITTSHVALYSGNIANKQGIEIVVAAARRLSCRSDLLFVVCGQGPNRAALEASAADLGNIRFFDLQPADRLSDLMGLASVHLLPQTMAAADLVLPSKLTNMLASARPVVATAEPGTGLAREIEGCGVVVAPGDAAAFADAISALIDDPLRHAALSAAARARAEAVWDKTAITRALLDDIEAVSSVPAPYG